MTIDEYLSKIQHMPTLLKGATHILKWYGNLARIDTESGTKLCTPDMNPYVTEVDYSWEDKGVVSFYLYESGIPVYSDPPLFEVATINEKGLGYHPVKDWDVTLKGLNINPDIIKKVKNILASKPPIDY